METEQNGKIKQINKRFRRNETTEAYIKTATGEFYEQQKESKTRRTKNRKERACNCHNKIENFHQNNPKLKNDHRNDKL